MAHELVEMERRKMEENIFQQQQEVEMPCQRLEEIENELRVCKDGSSSDMEGGSFLKKLMQVCNEDSYMVKSMDLDKSIDLETKVIYNADIVNGASVFSGYPFTNSLGEGIYSFPRCLTTVYEKEECEDEDANKNSCDDEVQKEVIEEKQMMVIKRNLS